MSQSWLLMTCHSRVCSERTLPYKTNQWGYFGGRHSLKQIYNQNAKAVAKRVSSLVCYVHLFHHSPNFANLPAIGDTVEQLVSPEPNFHAMCVEKPGKPLDINFCFDTTSHFNTIRVPLKILNHSSSPCLFCIFFLCTMILSSKYTNGGGTSASNIQCKCWQNYGSSSHARSINTQFKLNL